jgi:hypothetical protein
MKRSLDEITSPRKSKKIEGPSISIDEDSNSSISTPDLRSNEDLSFPALPLSEAIQSYFGREGRGIKNFTKTPSIPLELPAIPELPELPTPAESVRKKHSSALITDDNKEKTGSAFYQGKNDDRFRNQTSDPNLIVNSA